jgi:hypothetical protein
MVRRSVYEAVGSFTEGIVWGVDWHMWTRIALAGPVAFLAEPLALYRIHPESGTAGVMASARNAADEMWMFESIYGLVPPDRADLHALRGRVVDGVAHRTWCFGEAMCRRGFGRAARAQVRRAVSIRPSMLLKSKVWALWIATFLGYEWFARVHGWKRRVIGKAGVAPGSVADSRG